MRVSPALVVGLALALVGIGVVVGTSWNDPQPSDGTPSVQDVASLRDSCGAQELLVGVRGSGETSDQGGGLGNTIDSVYHRASGHLRTGQLVALPVDYVASSVQDPTLWSMYVQSFTQGRDQLFNALYLWNKKCPNYRFVLAGYSQGADVVAEVTTSLDPNIPTERDILNKIDAVILMGDPRYNPADQRVNAVPDLHYSGLRSAEIVSHLPFPMQASARPSFPDSVANRTHSWCQAKDPVCAFDGSQFATACPVNGMLIVNGLVIWAGSCIYRLKELIEPHLHYADVGMTEAAGVWIADRIKGATPNDPSGQNPIAPTATVVAQPTTTTADRSTPPATGQPTQPPVVSTLPPQQPATQPPVVPPPAAEVDPNPPPSQDPGNQPSLPPNAQPLDVDLDGYCSQWPGRRAALRYPNAWGWRCAYEVTGAWRSTDQNISVMDACAAQYGAGAISHYDNYLTPDSWKCWR